MADLKPFTQYRCATPDCGKSSHWTGAYSPEVRDVHDGICSLCGQPMVEVVDDGTRWRLTWEMDHLGRGWAPIARETSDEHEALDQFHGLLALQSAGERIRNITLARAVVSWQKVAADG